MDNSTLAKMVVVLLIGISAAFVIKYQKNTESKPVVSIPQKAPEVKPSVPKVEEKTEEKVINPRNYQEALDQAKKHKKDIFLFFHGDFCAPCQMMKKTLANAEVKKALNNYIYFEVDVERNQDLARKYKVSGIPNYKIINSDEEILKDGIGYKNPALFLKWLENKDKLMRKNYDVEEFTEIIFK